MTSIRTARASSLPTISSPTTSRAALEPLMLDGFRSLRFEMRCYARSSVRPWCIACHAFSPSSLYRWDGASCSSSLWRFCTGRHLRLIRQSQSCTCENLVALVTRCEVLRALLVRDSRPLFLVFVSVSCDSNLRTST
mmetsp:Transcript_18016/g.54244  ORF Transcript_18016/g.54244 Transcript_18016/m.54244 type:complete len:137 (+) Transcript_18016:1915-2325(+)